MHIMLRDLLTLIFDTLEHVDSENIKLKIGSRPLLYQLFSKRDFKSFLNLHARSGVTFFCAHFWVNKSLSMMWMTLGIPMYTYFNGDFKDFNFVLIATYFFNLGIAWSNWSLGRCTYSTNNPSVCLHNEFSKYSMSFARF
jgi:hypothetical protein